MMQMAVIELVRKEAKTDSGYRVSDTHRESHVVLLMTVGEVDSSHL